MVYCLLLFTQNILPFLFVSNHYSMSVYWSPFDHLNWSCNNKTMWWPLKPGATFSITIKLNFILDRPEKLSTHPRRMELAFILSEWLRNPVSNFPISTPDDIKSNIHHWCNGIYCLLLFTQYILPFLIVSSHYSMSVYWSPFDHLKWSCSNKAMKWPLKPGATFSIIIICHFRTSWKVEHFKKNYSHQFNLPSPCAHKMSPRGFLLEFLLWYTSVKKLIFINSHVSESQ